MSPPRPLPATPGDALLASLARVMTVRPDGSLVIKCGESTFEISPGGITITGGAGASIKLVGPAVNINNGALEVT